MTYNRVEKVCRRAVSSEVSPVSSVRIVSTWEAFNSLFVYSALYFKIAVYVERLVIDQKILILLSVLFVFLFFKTYLPLFAPKAPRLIKGAHNNTLIKH